METHVTDRIHTWVISVPEFALFWQNGSRYEKNAKLLWQIPAPPHLVAWHGKLTTDKTEENNSIVYCLRSLPAGVLQHSSCDAIFVRCGVTSLTLCCGMCDRLSNRFNLPLDFLWKWHNGAAFSGGAVSKCVERPHWRSHWEWDQSGLSINKVGG